MGSFTDDLLHRYKAQQAAGNVVDDTRDPTVARQAAVTGQQLGIPGPVVEADPKLYHNEVAAKKLQAQFGLDPHMADFFSNPDNAAVAKDDAPALGHISAAFGTADQVGDPLGARFISRMKASTAPGAWATRGALPGNAPTDNMLGTGDFNGALSTQQIRDVATHTGITTKSDLQSVNVLHALDTGLGATLDRTSLGIETFLADAVGMGDQYRGSDYYAQTRDALRKQEGRVDDLTSGFNDSQRWSYQAANSLGLLGIGVASGNPLAIFGATQGFGDYLTFRDRGATPNQAALGGGATAAIEVGTELLPMNYLLGQYGKKAAGKFLGGLLLREIPGELAATAGENLVDALMPGGVGWDQYKKDLPQAEIDTVASTILSAGVTAGAEGIAHHRAEVAKAAQDSGIAAAGAKFLDQTMTAAAESKNRKENPETIRQFVEQRAEKTPVRNIYVPAETIAAYQQSEGYKAGDPIEQFQEQIDQAKATGGDVVIPIGDAAASLSGTPTWEAIKDNARVEPGGLSQKEALAKHDEIMVGLEARGKAIAEQAAAAGDAAQTPGNAGEVFTDVKNRLLAGGVSPNEAEQVAHIYAAHYDTQAKLWKDTRPDLTPMQAWQEAKVVFPGENKGQVQGRQFGQETPLEGLPSRIKVDGQHVEFGPNAMARKAAAEHVAAQGLTYAPPTTYARVDPARATRIAQAFEEMKHEPNNPKVKRAYAAMMKETVAQWKAIEKTGLKVEFIKPGMADPYGNPRNAILDVQHNNHLWVFPTDDGFGGPASAGVDITGNPLLKTAPGVKIDGRAVKYNDVFRIVHDYFGHIKEGVGFRADGEENAWRMHSAMYSPEARAAMTTETRGQNSWVNFGPHGETNRTASPADTEYAPQKIGLLPDWVVNEGATDRTFDQAATIGGYEGLQQFLTDDEKKGLRQASIAKIMSIAEGLPDAKEMAAVAVAGRAKRGWYENSAQAILDVFGAADGTRFAALLAALSPQTSVQANLYNALKTWTAWNEAGRPTDRKAIVEVMGKSVQGGKGVGSILTAWINNNSVTALTHPEPAQIKLSGPKVDSFMNNLVGVVDEVTNDTWAANYAGVDPVLFRKTGQNKGPGYKAMNAVTRAAADVATKLTGEYWTPAEIQETVWSFAKTLYETRDKAGESHTMRQLLEAGRVTHDDIANTPDFATLFADGVYRTILEEGGYGNSLSTLGSNRRAVGVDGQASIASFDEGSGFTQADFSHFLAQAADRLEAVRNRRRGNVDTGGQRELFQQDVFNSLPNGDAVDAVGRVTAYHGTPFKFDRFSNDKGAVWFAEGRDLASQYSQGRRFRKATSGRVVEAELDIQHPLNITPEQINEEGDHSVISNPVEWAKRNFGFDLKAHGWEKTGQDYAHAIFRSQAFADAAREAGYDAIAVTEQGHKTWGMLRPGSILSPEDGRTLNQSQPAFYSALARALDDSKTTKASGEQWAATLRKTPGVKQEELEWSGLLDFLKEAGPFTRDQLREIVAKGGIQTEEVMLGEPNESGVDSEARALMKYNSDLSFEEARDAVRSQIDTPETQFHSWSSDPSNNSYRELLITLPPGVAGNPSHAPSTHWDQEGVIAHARFMDKTDADGKRVLFVEEVQSDWHQKGRDQGYETKVDPAAINAAGEAFDAANETFQNAKARLAMALNSADPSLEMGDSQSSRELAQEYAMVLQRTKLIDLDAREEMTAAYNALSQAELRMIETRNAHRNLTGNQGIPNAPFRTSWPALVMKRMIRHAAENGYDRIAWTTGEEQADRYNLSTAVGTITYRMQEDGRVKVNTEGDRGYEAFRQFGEMGPAGSTLFTEAQAKETFGQEITRKMWAGEGGQPDSTGHRKLEGSDLKIGGEGMKAFYDRNLVNITNDIVKKYGAKVGPVAVKGEDPQRKGLVNQLAKVDHPGFDITDKMKEAALGGLPLFQGEQGPRGSVTMQDDGTRIIQLFGTANKSTLLHETGHIWVQQLFDDAKLDNAPAQIKADAKAMAAWFKSLGHPIGKDGVIPTEAHEYAARGFERFFGEGKAPTAALQPAFSRFRAWMLNIYKVLENLKAPITPEVREVFSRMLATQDAINEAAQSNHVEPLFKTAADAGMTDAEFADYQQRVGDARDAAYDALLYKTMEAIRRRETEKQRGQRATARAEAHTAISSTPEFRALHLLRTGRWLGETDRPETPVKLSTGWLMDNFGEDVLDKLPRGLPIANANGVDGDTVAQMVGMPSGQALVHALLGMRTATDALRASGDKRSLRETMVEDQVNKAMADRHGDTLTNGSIEEEAIAALNTARQGEIIASEARQLSKRNTALGTPTPYQFAREWAKRKIAAGNVRDVASRAAVQQHTRATAKAARLAEEAILKGDIDEAYRQKQAQLLNHALLAESKAAADRIDVIIARMRRLAGRAAMKSVDPGYFDKIHMLLENYDFRARSQRSVEEQAGFQTWAEAQRAKGFEVNIPPRLENKGLPYSKVSVQELESLGDVIDSLLHLGKTKQTLVTAGKERDFAEQIDTTVASIAQRKDRKLTRRVWRRGKLVKEDLSPINEKARVGASLASEIVKIEAIAEDLDGGKTGPMNDLLVRGAADAENRRIALREKIMRPIIKLYSDIGAKHWDRLQTNATIPELTWNAVNEGDPRRGKTVTMTRMELLSVFMNMGNLSNLEKMTKGERWPAPTLHAVMERELVKEDYDLAQALWTQVEALWPEIVANERELSGVVPEKVVNNPISTRFGDYEGGYWPVVYDGSRWQRAEDLEGKKLDDMFGLKSGLATQKGHTIERTSAFGPLTYSLERVLLGHIDQVVTRIAYSAFARDTLRVIRNDRVRGIIDTKLGPEYRKQIEPWLARQIHEGAVNAKASAAWEKILRGFRTNVTIAGMGLRLSVGAAQISGLNASAARFAEGGNLATGAKWVAIGFKRYAQLIAQRNLDFVWSRSAEMTHRNDHFSREMSELSKKMQGRHSKWTDVQHWAMWHIGAADRYMVSLPTWLGAYEKGMKEGMTDEEASAYGDKEVRMSQGAGSEKDLSRWQSPNNDAMRFFTMFYTPFNVLFNAQWKSVREAKQGNFRPAIANGFWWMIASVLSDAMLSGDWPDPEDENGWAKWFARNVFFGLFAGVPIARDAAAYGERKVAGDYATFGTPIDRAMSSAEKGVKDAQLIAAGESPKRPIKEVGDLSALAFGVPTSAPGATGQFLWDYAHGEADPQSISDWYFGLTKGKVPPHDGAKQ